jgi:hypothetical protein
MKKTQILLASMVVVASVFTGCKKNKNENPTPDSPPVTITSSSTMIDFISKNGAQKQNFTVNVDNGQATITGVEGTKVTFPEDAFTTTSGQPVTGSISVQLVEIFDQAGMVLSDRPTTSNGQLLVSGGEIFIGATANGQTLVLNDSTSILITLPSDSVNAGMTLFTGSDSSQFNWNVIPNVVQTNNQQFSDTSWANDTIPYFYYDPSKYIFTITQLGWINCDLFYNTPNTTSINITCSGIVDAVNMRAYLVYKNINSVAQLWSNSTPGIFTQSNVPNGEPISIAVFCLKDGKEYLGIKEVTVSTNLSTTVELVESSEADIVALVKSKLN